MKEQIDSQKTDFMTTFAKKNKGGGGSRRPAGGMGLVSNNRLKKAANDSKPISEKAKIGADKPRVGASHDNGKVKHKFTPSGYKVEQRVGEVDVDRIANAVDNYLGPSDTAATKATDSSKYSNKGSDRSAPKGVPSIYQKQRKYSPRSKGRNDMSGNSNVSNISGVSSNKDKAEPKRNYKKPWQRPQTAGVKADTALKAAAESSKFKEERNKKASDIVSKRRQFKPAIVGKNTEDLDAKPAKGKLDNKYEVEVNLLDDEPEEAKHRAPKPYTKSSNSSNVLPKPSPRVMRKLNSADVSNTKIPLKDIDDGVRRNDMEASSPKKGFLDVEGNAAPPKVNSGKRASKMIGDIKKKMKSKHVLRPANTYNDETTGITMDINPVEDVHLVAPDHNDVDSSKKIYESNEEEEKMIDFNNSNNSKESGNSSNLVEDEDNLYTQDIDLAFNFADDNFELDDDDRSPLDGAGLTEIKEDEEIYDEFTTQKREIDQRISEIESDIKARWSELTRLSSQNKAELCYEFFKDNISDADDINDNSKMEKVHKFIKKQEVKNYRSFCFE
jgi:hypothetical protein